MLFPEASWHTVGRSGREAFAAGRLYMITNHVGKLFVLCGIVDWLVELN